MDTLELQHVDLAFGNKVKSPNIAVHQYVEFMVNDEPLSDVLNRHFRPEQPVLAKYTSTLGTMELTNFDRLKVKQLLAERVSDQELEKLFPSASFDHRPIRKELNLDRVLIYCCAECGNYECGGYFARISKGKTSYTWLFEENSKQLRLEFETDAYERVLDHYLASLDEE